MIFHENFKNFKKIKIFGKTACFLKNVSVFKNDHFFQNMDDFWKTREIFLKNRGFSGKRIV